MDTIVKSGGLSYSNTYDIEWIFPTSTILRRNFESIGMSFSGGNLADGTRSNVIKLFVMKRNYLTLLLKLDRHEVFY